MIAKPEVDQSAWESSISSLRSDLALSRLAMVDLLAAQVLMLSQARRLESRASTRGPSQVKEKLLSQLMAARS